MRLWIRCGTCCNCTLLTLLISSVDTTKTDCNNRGTQGERVIATSEVYKGKGWLQQERYKGWLRGTQGKGDCNNRGTQGKRIIATTGYYGINNFQGGQGPLIKKKKKSWKFRFFSDVCRLTSFLWEVWQLGIINIKVNLKPELNLKVNKNTVLFLTF